MALNKLYFDFELTENGWHALPLTEEEALRGTVGTKVVIRVIEHSHDEKPDIWYKAQILNICDDEKDKQFVRLWIEKFGMPKLMMEKCPADVNAFKHTLLLNS
ncbi:MAG: hypothetical protein JST89_00005 [Cyanobacteria bacterium SZAS-4]|nr:hypothetical protein [Cyanobacteria bacterium SZAS-4]